MGGAVYLGDVEKVKGKSGGDYLSHHMFGDFSPGIDVIRREEQLRLDKRKLYKLKADYQASGGGIDGAEELFLDAAQGLIIGNYMAKTARGPADNVSTERYRLHRNIDMLFNNIDYSSYTALSPDEVRAEFAKHGITQETYVDSFKSDTTKVVGKMHKQAEQFEQMNKEIRQVVDTIMANDSRLGGEFNQWQSDLNL